MRWKGGLAPGHERVDGMLRIGGISSEALAARYGTPLLVLDMSVLDDALDEFHTACSPHGIEVSYSGKALLLVALAQHLKGGPADLDVSSLGELATAERAHFDPRRITLHGCGKTDEELSAVFDGRVQRVVVDNLDELERFAGRADESRPIRLLLRVNTGIEAHTHAFIRTAGDQTKFGFDPPALARALRCIGKTPALQFIGLHGHIGSQIYDAAAFAENAAALMECAAQFARGGLRTEHIIVGGGFGVQSAPDAEGDLDLPAVMQQIAATVRSHADRLHLPVPRIGIEPGRAVIAHAGTSLYRVMAAKSEVGRPYAIVDGGIFENPRPALYDAYHHFVAAHDRSPSVTTTICGRTCENDRLSEALLPADLHAGEVLAACTTGAYTYSMASNYNRFPRPAVVGVNAGTHRLLARRETIDDLLEADVGA